MTTITAYSSRGPGLAKLNAGISQTQHQSFFFSVPASTEACSASNYNMGGGTKWMEGQTKPKILSKQPKKTKHFIRGFCAHEQQGKEHRHAGHAEQLNLWAET